MQTPPGDTERVPSEADDANTMHTPPEEVEDEQPINPEITEVQEEGNPHSPSAEHPAYYYMFSDLVESSKASPKKPQTLGELMKEEDEKSFPSISFMNEETNDWFYLQDRIGTAYNGVIKVHQGYHSVSDKDELNAMSPADMKVSLKAVPADQESEAFNDLKQRVEKNGLVPHHPNIMGIKKPFTVEGLYYVAFPFMDFGSLRCIMAKTFPNGLPEDFIVVALREALQGLSWIHRNGQVHKEITAGHIFCSNVPEIKLAFSASIYDHDLDENRPSSSSSHLPMATIFNWAAAPEIYNSQNNEYTAKADIWLIGISALELAYGKFGVSERADLESIVEKITAEKRLPTREEGRNDQTLKEISSSPKGDSIKCVNVNVMIRRRAFTKRFKKTVLNCLAMDPAKRPTADKLLRSKIFEKKNDDVIRFGDFLTERLI